MNDLNSMANFSSLEEIALAVKNCSSCGLCTTRKNTVSGMGVVHPAVLVIGEGPGADEDATGLPFVGKAGQLLDKMLASISLWRTTNCFIANIVKCRPPANRDPLPEESQACAKYLNAQIALLKPKMILLLGRIALHNLLNTSEGISKVHGKWLSYQGIPVMAIYHPSALLRNESLKAPAWEDLKEFRNRLKQIMPNYENTVR